MKAVAHSAVAGAGNEFVLLTTEKTRILVDPVSSCAGAVDAVLLSRFSPGLILPDPKTPLYASFGVKALIDASCIIAHSGASAHGARILKEKDKKPVRIGDIIMRAYPAGECGFDARAFLFEAGEERVLYINPRTMAGKRERLFGALVNDKGAKVIEEAMPAMSEYMHHDDGALQAAIGRTLAGPALKAFLRISAYDIDGIVSAHRACRAAGAELVIDLFTAFTLAMVRRVSKRVPQYDSESVRVRFSADQATALKDAGYGPLVHAFGKREHKIDIFELNRSKRRFLFAVQDETLLRALVKELDDAKGAAVISATDGNPHVGSVS